MRPAKSPNDSRPKRKKFLNRSMIKFIQMLNLKEMLQMGSLREDGRINKSVLQTL